MILLGLTGGIGSGKTWVARILQQRGIPVYLADDRARTLMNESPEIQTQVKKLFGTQAYLPDRTLNRAWIGNIVFRNPEMLKQLNTIVHPATRADFEQWCNEFRDKGIPVLVKEAAILYESGADAGLDAVCMVYAPLAVRLQRVMQRDHRTEHEVMERISNQWPDHRKCLLSDYMIINDGTHPVEPQIDAMLARLCSVGSGH